MKILVTGGAGFIGSSLTDALLKRGDTVIAIDNFNDYYSPARKWANVAPFENHPKYTLYTTDFRDRDAIADILQRHKPTAVAHLGAMGSVRYSITHPHLYTAVNITGSVNVLDAANEVGVENFVFASTSSVYGQTEQIPFVESQNTDLPLAPYPASKKSVEVMGHAYHNMHGLNFTALRFFNVYGPKGRPDMMPYIVTDKLVKGEEITLFDNGKMRRDWTYIDDILSGVIAALDRPLGYERINLGRGEPIWMTDFIEILEQITGEKATINAVPAPASEPKITFANIDKARRLLDYDPQTSVSDGLAKFWAWYRGNVIQVSHPE